MYVNSEMVMHKTTWLCRI